ncbi:DUF6090 family protein [Reichenbachiella ulvae]|uniref:DUF6090 family protein n=1 Tax=Reichenbachiella ulvae TaxID=2980104 RepID=A0ABT3CUF3_9BACT|nr:DUF6090 family protein [Reichenbachiella ulvae]MCV9387327.1 DUF6090 family protein [Reichenbachiella ulvae]
MIKFFRKIRQNLITENNFSKYLFYAIGEIILVVIGILIAVQINDFKNTSVENELEQNYLTNLIIELRQDSVGFTKNYREIKTQARTKSLFLDIIRGRNKSDSIIVFFEYQWKPIQPYIPVKATFTEMSSSSHLRIIKNDMLREKIIKLYSSYEAFEKEETLLLQTSTQNIINRISQRIPDMSNYNTDDIMSLKSDNYLLNCIQLNGAYTRRDNYKEMIDRCTDLIKSIEQYRLQKFR